ncbi:putative membrane protein [Streptomyces davaonensis JCM 4913]|uniref:Putative membrane protein n=1 Tax=Streptomyces davaonensis (strain DSM 101723 / JCM 4913 / KCC S-0913 / 768) TaxID=1214101 RepID=K4R409_STRDJ|nr:hypothetical protein [Streptomyces davaonensis]CCK27847.1 putative membrane protein [Streptomyces davaonensis JCM 4913]
MTTTESARTATADNTAADDTDDTVAPDDRGAADDTAVTPPLRLFGPRGRHRRPRPRKILLAAGGLALAAGALSLVRLTPESGLGSLGTPEAEPWTTDDSGTDPGTGHSTNAAATVDTVPRVSPSATSAMGGLTAAPTETNGLGPTPSGTAVPPPLNRDPATTIPEAPQTTAPQPPTTSAAPQPRPTTSPNPQPSSAPPSPAPSPADRPGVCLPIIGLCVDPLTARDDSPSEARTAPRHGG